MKSFDEFRHTLNQRPVNTRSSLIASQFASDDFSKNNSTFDLCRRQPRSIEPVNPDFEFITDRRKTFHPFTTLTQSEHQDISEDRSDHNFQRTPLEGEYNSSGKPFNLSDFRNDMTSEFLFDNNNRMTYGPSRTSNFLNTFHNESTEGSLCFLTNSNFYLHNDAHRKSNLIPYDDSGRTFNLSEFRRTYESNSPQYCTCTNETSCQHLMNTSECNQRSTTQNEENSRITFHHDPCESFKNSCRNFCQRSQYQQNQCNAVPRRVAEFQNGKNVKKKTTPSVQERVPKKSPLFENLVKDRYHPGIIVETVNGLIDFNKIAFGLVFDCENIPLEIDQEHVPMSLLEAFDLRISYEQDLRNDFERRKLFCVNEFKNGQTEATVEHEDDERKEGVPYWTHRDELKLASTIDIDLMTKVANFPETPLTEAINCLLKAEKMDSFDRNVHLAEKAIRTASDGQQELAALKSTCSFKLDIRKDETKTTNTYEPLAIISYIGTTKPNNVSK